MGSRRPPHQMPSEDGRGNFYASADNMNVAGFHPSRSYSTNDRYYPSPRGPQNIPAPPQIRNIGNSGGPSFVSDMTNSQSSDIFYEERNSSYHRGPPLDRGGNLTIEGGPRPLMEQRLPPPIPSDQMTYDMMPPSSTSSSSFHNDRKRNHETPILRDYGTNNKRFSSDTLAPRSTRDLMESGSGKRDLPSRNPSNDYRDQFDDRVNRDNYDQYNEFSYQNHRNVDYERASYQPQNERSPPLMMSSQHMDNRHDFRPSGNNDYNQRSKSDEKRNFSEELEDRYHRFPEERQFQSTLPRFYPEESKEVDPRKNRNEDRRYDRRKRSSSPFNRSKHRNAMDHNDKQARRTPENLRNNRGKEEDRKKSIDDGEEKIHGDNHGKSPIVNRKREVSVDQFDIAPRSTKDLLKDSSNANIRRTSSPPEKMRRVSPSLKSSAKETKKVPRSRAKSSPKKFPKNHPRRKGSYSKNKNANSNSRRNDDKRGRRSASPKSNTHESEEDRSNRTSALKRLGPKLSITERLGSKDKKEGVSDISGSSRSGKDMKITILSSSSNKKSHDEESIRIVDEVDINSVAFKCPHCDAKETKNSNDYLLHFKSGVHSKAMKSMKFRLRLTLTRMRQKQRSEQKEKENELAKKKAENAESMTEKVEDDKTKKRRPPPPIYCKSCKLVFHTKRSEHNKGEMHNLIKKFLSPHCLICNLKFFSPMAYEKHLSSLEHLKKKAELNKDGDVDENKESSQCSKADLMTLDEVGEVDDDDEIENMLSMMPIEDEPQEITNELQTEEEINEEPTKKDEIEKSETLPENSMDIPIPDPDESIGEDYVKPVTMYFCNLCHKFLPRCEPEKVDEILVRHCKSFAHRNAFIKKKNEETNPNTETKNASEDNVVECNFNEDLLDYEPAENGQT